MSKTLIYSPDAPPPIGPYAQAVKAGDLLFCSGQIPLDPKTGELVKGDIEAQTRQVMQNLREVLQAGGGGWESVVRTTIYLTNLGDFAVVNRVYGEYVGTDPPARATVQVAALPKGAAIEIDAVAHIPMSRGAST
jgi:2-iminobutanoate/2-iminopropanoate deaminase